MHLSVSKMHRCELFYALSHSSFKYLVRFFATFSCKINYSLWEIVSAISVSIIVWHGVTVAMCWPHRIYSTLSQFIHSFIHTIHKILYNSSTFAQILYANKKTRVKNCAHVRRAINFQRTFFFCYCSFFFHFQKRDRNSMQRSQYELASVGETNVRLHVKPVKFFFCLHTLHILYVYYANVENYNCKLLFLPFK